MRLSSATTSDSVLAQLQRLSGRQAELQRQVATGQRIFEPGDDPAAAARIITDQTERRALRQFNRNVDAALEHSKASYSGLEQTKRLSDRAGELAVLGTGAVGTQAMRAYAAEVDQLIEQAASLANTRLRENYLYAGASTDTPPFALTRNPAGQVTAATYVGDATRPTIPLADGASIQPGTSSTTNNGLSDFLNHLVALRDALVSGNGSAVQATRPSLAADEDILVDSLSEHGAIQLRLEVAEAQQKSRLDQLDRQIATESDVDLPEVIVRLNQTSQAYEAALSSSATILRLSLLDYIN